MPSVARHLRKLVALGLLATPAHAGDDWQAVTFISDTVGNHSNRLCMGVPDHMRGSDIGCPTYAPSLTTGGHVSITGNVSANRFIGDGSGLTGVAAATGDRIVSGSTGGTRMVAISDTGYISITQAGANTGWFDPTRGLVTLGVSATGAISGTTGYFRNILRVGQVLDWAQRPDVHVVNATAAMIGMSALSADAAFASTVLGNDNGNFRLQTRTRDGVFVSNDYLVERGPTGATSHVWRVGNTETARLGPSWLRVVGTISASDAIQVGNSSLTCGAGIAGALRYSGSKIEYCNGVAWSALVGAADAMGDRIVSGSTNIIAYQDRSLTFTTNNQQRMVIGANGYIGVGTSTPETALDILNDSFAGSPQDNALIGVTSQNRNAGLVLRAAANRAGSVQFHEVGNLTALGLIEYYNSQSGSPNAMRFTTSGTEKVRITHAGNVGIGTTTPAGKLSVAGTISASDAIQVGSSSLSCGAGIAGALRYSGSKIEYCNGVAWGALVGAAEAMGDRIVSGSTNIIAHQDRSLTFTTAGAPRMVIGEDGNVGIGNVHLSSAVGLAVYRDMGGVDAAQLWLSNGLGARMLLGQSGSGANAFSLIKTDANEDLYFQMGRAANSDQPRMVIKSANNGANIVGIDTISPTATLQVSGSFIVSTSAQTTTPSLFVGTNGRVGIGTNNPGRMLHVAGSNPEMMFTDTDTGAHAVMSGNSADGSFYINADVTKVGANPLLGFGVSNTNFVFLNANRALYIGTGGVLSPQNATASLTVVGTVSVTDAIQVGTSALTCGAGIPGAIRYNAGGLEYCDGIGPWRAFAGAGASLGDRIVSGTTNITAHQDRSLTFTTNNQQRMVISEQGNLGFGTDLPEARVHIATGNPRIRFTDTDTGARHDIDANSSFGALFVDVDSGNAFPNSALFFRNAGTNLVTISKTGHVGIGETNPTARLVVRNTGSLNATNTHQAIFQDDSNDGLSGGLAISSYHPRLLLHDRSAGDAWFDWRADGDLMRLGAGNMADQFTRVTDTIISVHREGRVGIGTAPSTVTRLHVSQHSGTDAIASFTGAHPAHSRVFISNDVGADAQLSFMNTGTSQWTLGNRGSTNNFTVRSGAGAFGTAADRLTIVSGTGHVGIGTSSPSSALVELVSTSDPAGLRDVLALANYSANSEAQLLFRSNRHAVGNFTQSAIRGKYQAGGLHGGLSFLTAFDDVLYERMVITRDGRVGIGTEVPSVSLTVVGEVQVSNSGVVCNSFSRGAIRYTSAAQALSFCNGSTWSQLAAAGATTAASSTGAVQFNANNQLAGDTNNFFWDNANKWLGIGTNTPSLTVHVYRPGGHHSSIMVGADAGYSAGFGLQQGHNGYRWLIRRVGSGDDMRVYNYGLERDIAVWKYDTGNMGVGMLSPTATLQVSGSFIVSTSGQQASSPSFVVTNDGVVGIGVSSPAGQLSNAATNRVDHEGTGIGINSINWLHHGAGYIAAFETQYHGVSGHGLLVKGGSNAHNYLFNVVGGNQSRLMVRGDGNVGVGTAAPLALSFSLKERGGCWGVAPATQRP